MMRNPLSTIILAVSLVTPCFANDIQEGETIMNNVCAEVCHQRPEVKSLKISQWKIVLKIMRKRMETREMTPLSEKEEAQLLVYLNEHARE